MLRANWDPQLILFPVAEDEFENGDFETLVFHGDAKHRIRGFKLFLVKARNIAFGKIN
jgi:hypothetical protein